MILWWIYKFWSFQDTIYLHLDTGRVKQSRLVVTCVFRPHILCELAS